MTKKIKKRLVAVMLAVFMVLPTLPVYGNWAIDLRPTITLNPASGILEFNLHAPVQITVFLYMNGIRQDNSFTSDHNGHGWFNLNTIHNVPTNSSFAVRAWDASGLSWFSNQVSWPPWGQTWGAPTGLGVSGTTLHWHPFPNAFDYEVELRDINNTLINDFITTSTSWNFGHLPQGAWNFRVRARGQVGVWVSEWSPFYRHTAWTGGGGGNVVPGQLPTPSIHINSNGVLQWSGGVARRIRVYSDGFELFTSETEVTAFNLHQHGVFPGSQIITMRFLHPTNPNLNSNISNSVPFGTAGWNQMPTPNISINHNTGVLTWAGGGLRWIDVYVDGEPFHTSHTIISSINLRDIGIPPGTHPIRIRHRHETNPDWNSQLSNTINFNAAGAAVATPTIQINQNTGRLTWTGGGNRIVRVYAGNDIIWTSPGNVNHVDLLSIGLPTGSQAIRVRHLHATNSDLHSALSNAINFNAGGRPLATPSISINNTTGILTWSGGVSRQVAVYSGGNLAWTSPNAVTQVDLNGIGLNTGNQSIRIRHLHETDNTLNSNLSNTMSFNVTTPPALSAPFISINQQGILTWAGGDSYMVRLYIGGSAGWASPMAVNQVNLNQILVAPGTHNIQLRLLHDVNANLNSPLSNIVTFVVEHPADIVSPRDANSTHNAVTNALGNNPWASQIILTLPDNANGVRIGNATLIAVENSNTNLTFELNDMQVTLTPAAMAEIRNWSSGDVDLNFQAHRGGGLPSFNLGVQSGAGNLATLQNPIGVSVNIGPTNAASFHRIVAVNSFGAPVGGSFNPSNGRFDFNANVMGSFSVQNRENLVRLLIQMDSYQIVDLAGNAPAVHMDVLPVIMDGRTLLPVSFLAQALGANVTHTNATPYWPLTVHLNLGGQNLDIPVGAMSHELEALGMDVPAQIIQDRTMVPLRFIGGFFGANVTWDNDTRSIEVLVSN